MTNIVTDRLVLVPYQPDYVSQHHVDWLNDKEVTKYSEQRLKYHTIQTQVDYLSLVHKQGYNKIWLIVIREGPDIGSITAYCDAYNLVANLGILIGDRDSWGKGFGYEAWSAVMDYCCNDLEMRKIECGMMAKNASMKKLAERSGMVLEGVVAKHFRDDDMLLYGKLKNASAAL